MARGASPSSARRYAPTLVPIVAVYFAAHYFDYLVVAGQATLGVLVDPLGHSWNPGGLGEYPIRKGVVPAAGVWWTQIVLIVAGHVAGIVAAHRVALRRSVRPAQVLAYQAPLVLLMVAYSVAGLGSSPSRSRWGRRGAAFAAPLPRPSPARASARAGS
ncbi:MAG TPA: hypothetical protein VE596_12520 [Gaiellaceae bacterium]|nr:hypothetical protein [Gaiellaceae bacterium]